MYSSHPNSLSFSSNFAIAEAGLADSNTISYKDLVENNCNLASYGSNVLK